MEKFQNLFEEMANNLKNLQKTLRGLKKSKKSEKKEIKKISDDINKLVTDLVDTKIPKLNIKLCDEVIVFLRNLIGIKGIILQGILCGKIMASANIPEIRSADGNLSIFVGKIEIILKRSSIK